MWFPLFSYRLEYRVSVIPLVGRWWWLASPTASGKWWMQRPGKCFTREKMGGNLSRCVVPNAVLNWSFSNKVFLKIKSLKKNAVLGERFLTSLAACNKQTVYRALNAGIIHSMKHFNNFLYIFCAMNFEDLASYFSCIVPTLSMLLD